MTNIIPSDYVKASDVLAKAGFKAIQTLLDNDSSIADVATLYGIDQHTVEVVKTTSNYGEYLTIVRLETERQNLSQQLEASKRKSVRAKPKTWHYVVASIILLAIVMGLIYGVASLISWLSSMGSS